MKKVLSTVMVSILTIGLLFSTLVIGNAVAEKRSDKLIREQIEQIRLSAGYIPKN